MPDVIEQLRSYGDGRRGRRSRPVEVPEPRNRRPLIARRCRRPRRSRPGSPAGCGSSSAAARTPTATRGQHRRGRSTHRRMADPRPRAPGAAGGRGAGVDRRRTGRVGRPRQSPTSDGFDDGAAYDPTTATWRTDESGADLRGGRATGVWTGDEVLLAWRSGSDGSATGGPAGGAGTRRPTPGVGWPEGLETRPCLDGTSGRCGPATR